MSSGVSGQVSTWRPEALLWSLGLHRDESRSSSPLVSAHPPPQLPRTSTVLSWTPDLLQGRSKFPVGIGNHLAPKLSHL